MPPVMSPSAARSTPRTLSARASMSGAPTARADSIARSANGAESLARPASMRFAARPARTRAWSTDAERAREQVDGLLEEADRGRRVAGQPRCEAEPLAGPRAALEVVLGAGRTVDELDGALSELDRSRSIPDDRRGGARRVVEVPKVAVGGAVFRRHGLPHLDGTLVLAGRLREGEDRPRRVAGRDRGTQGASRLVGRRPVVGQLGEPVGGGGPGTGHPALEGVGVGRMEAAPLRRQQLVVRGFLDEGVAESIALDDRVGIDDQELRVDHFVERGLQVGLGQATDVGQQVVVDLATRHGGDPDEARRRFRSAGQTGEQDAAERLRQARPPLAGLVDRRGQLLGEEGVAVGAGGDRLDQLGRRWRAGDGRQQLVELVAPEPREIDPLDPWLALGLGQPGRERVLSIELVISVGPDHQEPFVANVPGEERQQVARGAIGPVEVLGHEEDRRRVAESAEQAQDPFEDADLEPVRGSRLIRRIGRHDGELGDEAGELGQAGSRRGGDPVRVDGACQRPKGLDQGTKRQTVIADRDRPALEHEPAIAL